MMVPYRRNIRRAIFWLMVQGMAVHLGRKGTVADVALSVIEKLTADQTQRD